MTPAARTKKSPKLRPAPERGEVGGSKPPGGCHQRQASVSTRPLPNPPFPGGRLGGAARELTMLQVKPAGHSTLTTPDIGRIVDYFTKSVGRRYAVQLVGTDVSQSEPCPYRGSVAVRTGEEMTCY